MGKAEFWLCFRRSLRYNRKVIEYKRFRSTEFGPDFLESSYSNSRTCPGFSRKSVSELRNESPPGMREFPKRSRGKALWERAGRRGAANPADGHRRRVVTRPTGAWLNAIPADETPTVALSGPREHRHEAAVVQGPATWPFRCRCQQVRMPTYHQSGSAFKDERKSFVKATPWTAGVELTADRFTRPRNPQRNSERGREHRLSRKVRPWMAVLVSTMRQPPGRRSAATKPRSWKNAKTVESACKPGPVRLAA